MSCNPSVSFVHFFTFAPSFLRALGSIFRMLIFPWHPSSGSFRSSHRINLQEILGVDISGLCSSRMAGGKDTGGGGNGKGSKGGGGLGSRAFLFCFVLLLYIVALYIYAWQRHRAFQDYDRCMGWLEKKCPCFHKVLSVVVWPFGKLMRCSLYLLGACCKPIDKYAKTACPGCWLKYRRCLQHTIGACFYTSTRMSLMVDNSGSSGMGKRAMSGPAPAMLKEKAKDLNTAWSSDRLGEAVEVLEESCAYLDAYRPPFKQLRLLVIHDISKQLEEALKPGVCSLDKEAMFFLAKGSINYGKDTGSDADYADTSELFAHAGPMETANTLIAELIRAGCSLKHESCFALRPTLDGAARDRANWALSQPGHKPLQYALLCAATLQALSLPEVVSAGKKYKELRGLPASWDMLKLVSNQYGAGRLVHKPKVFGTVMGAATLPGSTAWGLQQLLDDTYKNTYTKDRGDGKVPDRLVLVHAQEVQNEQNYVEYMARQKAVKQQLDSIPLDSTRQEVIHEIKTMKSKGVSVLPGLDSTVQEAWLWHGTSQAGAEGITSEDFRLNFAGSGAGTLYGRGIYLAEMCSKSDEYTKEEGAEHYLLLCRATLGRCYYCDEKKPDPNKLEDCCIKGKYHSVLGDREKIRNTYREIMVYDDDQVYPAYIVRYRRQYYDD
eukprot:TRINITY_DN29805_c0_g1_i1.p1 TRINITY_DN29805_c0_g1~~TRINITY_DN29805_c0_g1_i1.p1  ORF type:complete len:664 (+),score=102.90 TRINITY_DN29805_c0_g1_i1:135-2126(+)